MDPSSPLKYTTAELLINLHTRMLHFNAELYHIFMDTQKIFGKSSFAIANDENWPHSLTIAEMLINYENDQRCKRSLKKMGSITPPFFTPSATEGSTSGRVTTSYHCQSHPTTHRDLQPIPARTRPSIIIPVEPTYVPETPEVRIHSTSICKRTRSQCYQCQFHPG